MRSRFSAKLSQASPEALDATFRIASGFGWQTWVPALSKARASLTRCAHLPQEHPCNTNTISADVADLLAFADLFGAAIDGFVGVLIRCGAASPFEKADQVAANLEIPVGRDVAIGLERGQQAVERLLSERPFLPCRVRQVSTAIPLVA